MTVSEASAATALTPVPATASEYLGLDPQQRYDVVSQQFSGWLLAEPVAFPAHHPTYAWDCRVEGCDSSLHQTAAPTNLLCVEHRRQFAAVKNTVTFDDFLAAATPNRSKYYGHALFRSPDCGIGGCRREQAGRGYCRVHLNSLRRATKVGYSEEQWRPSQQAMGPARRCTVERCVHDKALKATLGEASQELCATHGRYLNWWLQQPRQAGRKVNWKVFFADPGVVNSTLQPETRGLLPLAGLPPGLQREIRYALHRHAQIAWRAQWRPGTLREVVELLATAGVDSLGDPRVIDLAAGMRNEKPVLAGLVSAARSLLFTAESAKKAGWFDPILVGATPFHEGGGSHRRKPWDLTHVSQIWLRDLLWNNLRDEALNPMGKRATATTIHSRLAGVGLLSITLDRNRADHGEDASALGKADAEAIKQTWDLWFAEKIALPVISPFHQPRVLTELSRMTLMAAIRMVLRSAREQNRTPTQLDPFILSLPEYPVPQKKPRPRPLSYGDFQQLVAAENLHKFDELDADNTGLSDIWLTPAFQGGRIIETLGLRLGCIGIVGAAQPYIWRDIAKVGVIDYGMPCYLPVYERLLQRQETTRARLRLRYRDELAVLDARGRARLEATWDREMPLFPRVNINYDLRLFISASTFRDLFNEWLEGLGLASVTSHQTRATLATSLLNNGAPPALVRQLLGHFSEEALAHYANYSNETMARHLQKIWAAGPGMDKPGTILLRPTDLNADNLAAAAARIDLTVVPVERGLCRYGPVVGGSACPYGKNCSDGPQGPCEHFVLTGADLAYWERKRDAAVHFAEGAPTAEARDYILSQWERWEPVLTGLRAALDELGLLEAAEQLDLRSPVHDYFHPLFATGFPLAQPLLPSGPA